MSAITTDPYAALRGRSTINVPEVAPYIGVSSDSLWREIRNGTLPFPFLRVGKRVVIPVVPFLRFMEGGEA